jgi:hypothetical protein
VNKKKQKNFANLGRCGFSAAGPVSKKFLRRFFQKAATFFLIRLYFPNKKSAPRALFPISAVRDAEA